MIFHKNRSNSYIGTVDLSDPLHMEEVKTVRAMVREVNQFYRDSDQVKRLYVKLQGRGPRPSRQYHQSLPLSMAKTADIYVYERL